MKPGDKFFFRTEDRSDYVEDAGSIWPPSVVITQFYNDPKHGICVSFVNAKNMKSNLDEFNGAPIKMFRNHYQEE